MVLEVFIYLAVAGFIVLSLRKALQYAKMPMHTRWELYPVPKEKGRGEYGGSYYEEPLWWQKPRETSFLSELADMLKEMLFIKKLFDNQRPLWWLSYAMHLGIYLLIAWALLLCLGGLTVNAGGQVAPGQGMWSSFLFYLTLLTGAAGGLLVAFGSLSLLIKRCADSSLRIYSNPQDYFNLLLIFVVAATGLGLWVHDPVFAGARQMAAALLRFEPLALKGLMAVHVVLLGLLLLYIPTSKMSHYVGKYFSFHKVLWDNEPNLPHSAIMKAVEEGQQYKPSTTWSAPHIKSPPSQAAGQ